MKKIKQIIRDFKNRKIDYLQMSVDTEVERVRTLSANPYSHKQMIIADALKTQSMILAYGLNPGDLEELCKYFAQKGLPK